MRPYRISHYVCYNNEIKKLSKKDLKLTLKERVYLFLLHFHIFVILGVCSYTELRAKFYYYRRKKRENRVFEYLWQKKKARKC